MNSTTETGRAGAISDLRICFYGAGSMAEALVRSIIHNQLTSPGQISMLNRQNKDRLRELHDRYGIQTVLQGFEHDELLRSADVVLLAMKPKDAADALELLKPLFNENQLIISVIAGLSIETIKSLLGKRMPIVRTMPNTSSTIGLGVTALSYSDEVTETQRLITEQLFGSVGMTEIVEEKMVDRITGISGSGPAYVYYFMEAMTEAAVELGFDSETARRLVVQTFLGASEMMRLTGEDPAELRRKVTSPGGTTQAAIELMAQEGLKETLLKAIFRCVERATEIGQETERKINQ